MILFVGRNNPQNGPEHLKEIVFNVLKAQSSFKALILGSRWNLDYFNEEIQDRIKLILQKMFLIIMVVQSVCYTLLYMAKAIPI